MPTSLIMLQQIECFLPLYLLPQLFFRRQIELVFRGKQLFVAFQDGVSCNVLVRFRTENDAYGRAVAFRPFQFVVHPHVHVHLSDILMGDFAHFQVHEDITFQHHVVEYKVDEIRFCKRVCKIAKSGIVR